MRTNELYLRDIVDAADAIAAFVSGLDAAAFAANDLVASAVQMKLVIIGEAATRVTQDLKDKYPIIPWKKVAAYRNFAVHVYFAVDNLVVWETVSVHAPKIRSDVQDILTTEFSP